MEIKILGEKYFCIVCETNSTYVYPIKILLNCPKCNANCYVSTAPSNKSNTQCEKCNYLLTTDDIISQCNNLYYFTDDDPTAAYCSACEYDRPSVFFIENYWTCVICFDRGWDAFDCPHCGQFITGGGGDYLKYIGCTRCEENNLEENAKFFDRLRLKEIMVNN